MPTVLIAGGSGLIGSHLSQMLQRANYQVIHLSRKEDLQREIPRYGLNLEQGKINLDAIEKADYIINLAGAGIADKRWTKSRKQLIIDSRVQSTLLLKQGLQELGKKCKTYISASAIGYYGNRGDVLLHENDAPGDTGFLAESTLAWEAAAQELASATERLAIVRIGIVLSTQGGALPEMMMPLKFRVGSYFGNGSMYYSWIHIDDLCQIFLKIIETEEMSGIYNGVAPQPVTNYELTKSMAKAKNIGVIPLPAPPFALRLLLGEMADVVLHGARVSSDKILAAGFDFAHPEIISALQDLFKRKV